MNISFKRTASGMPERVHIGLPAETITCQIFIALRMCPLIIEIIRALTFSVLLFEMLISNLEW